MRQRSASEGSLHNEKGRIEILPLGAPFRGLVSAPRFIARDDGASHIPFASRSKLEPLIAGENSGPHTARKSEPKLILMRDRSENALSNAASARPLLVSP